MLSLPADILILIFETLSVSDLTSLSLTCHDLHNIVTTYGWSAYLRANPRPSYTLSKTRSMWTPHQQALYDNLTDHAWSKPKFISRPICRPWAGKLQPVLAISPSRLVIGAWSNLHSYAFGAPNRNRLMASPPVRYEGSVSLLFAPGTHPHLEDRPRSITAISFVPDGGRDVVLDVAFLDGALERVILQPPSYSSLFDSDTPNSSAAPILQMSRTKLASMPNNDFIESLSVDSTRSVVLALASNGGARLSSIPQIDYTNLDDPLSLSSLSISDPTASHISISCRSWKSLLSLSSPYPYAAFGSSSSTPLVIHSITDGATLSPFPSAILHIRSVVDKIERRDAKLRLDRLERMQNVIEDSNTSTSTSTAGDSKPPSLPSSAVYGLTHAPHCAPWGASSQVLVSGWFDGEVRIYDLRNRDRYGTTTSYNVSAPSSAPASTSTNSTPLRSSTPAQTRQIQVPLLKPSLTLADKWSDEPIYAVSAGGGSGACVAAGTGRHSVVAMFDVRVGGYGGLVGRSGDEGLGVVSAYAKMNENSSTTNGGGGGGRGMSTRWGRDNDAPGADADGDGDGDDLEHDEGLMKGWSVHAPGNDQSPVYDVVMESDRVWGVTQARGFVFDFVSSSSLFCF
ncbi:hypothetical protein CVT24_004380 [Panaeolus cyanescens]|uniref:F-box domain-containing protein n=1 Tax=Panaeolus cyanescens TaxID=181874 RepID=A0A409VEJ6_9AGAR|nr:hypothetical protein CVT24_004380 [Panaeolus cyanescens]